MSDKILKLDQAQTLYQDLRGRIDALPTSGDIPEVPVQDVQVVGVSVLQNGVANVPVASRSIAGVVKHSASSNIKAGTDTIRVIAPANQHESTFYGLAKAAGHDEKNSTESLGTYTPEAKGAIQKMLGVSDLIATEENNLVASKAYAVGDVFTANGKLYKATAAIAVDGAIITDGANANCEETSVGEGFVKNTDYAAPGKYGTVMIGTQYGIGLSGGFPAALRLLTADSTRIKAGTETYQPITPVKQHESVFYGLAKAAGADEKDSTNPVGTYTAEAKAAIKTMLGVEEGLKVVRLI